MVVGGPQFYVRPDETIRIEARVRGIWILRSALVAVLVAAVLSVPVVFLVQAGRDVPNWVLPSWFAVVGLLCLLRIAVAWRRVVTTEYVVTDETAYRRIGRFLLLLEAVPMDKITDTTVQTTLLGRVFGYANLQLRTAGGAPQFIGLKDAYAIRGVIEDQRKAFIQRLLKEAGRQSGAKERDDDGDGKTSAQCPRCRHVFEAGRRRPADVTCPRCGLEGTLFAEATA